MKANNKQLSNKLCQIENALYEYSNDASFLAIQQIKSDSELVKELEQLSYLLIDAQDQANQIIDALRGLNHG